MLWHTLGVMNDTACYFRHYTIATWIQSILSMITFQDHNVVIMIMFHHVDLGEDFTFVVGSSFDVCGSCFFFYVSEAWDSSNYAASMRKSGKYWAFEIRNRSFFLNGISMWNNHNYVEAFQRRWWEGPKPERIFLICCRQLTRAWSPGPSTCQAKPTDGKSRQSATPARSILRAVHVFGWSKTERACVNRYRLDCWILLDLVA